MGTRTTRARTATMAGLLTAAAGIIVLWASGVDFPFFPPPGVIVLVAGTLVVGLARWRFAPAVGSALALFIIVGFFVSPQGIPNFRGDHGTGAAIGTYIQLAGLFTALVAGVLATAGTARAATGTPAPTERF